MPNISVLKFSGKLSDGTSFRFDCYPYKLLINLNYIYNMFLNHMTEGFYYNPTLFYAQVFVSFRQEPAATE